MNKIKRDLHSFVLYTKKKLKKLPLGFGSNINHLRKIQNQTFKIENRVKHLYNTIVLYNTLKQVFFPFYINQSRWLSKLKRMGP